MIKAVVFDFGGVFFTDGFKSAIAKFHRNFKIPAKSLKKELVQGIGKDYCCGRIGRKEFWKRFKRSFRLEQDYEKLDQMWNSCYCMNYELRDIARALRKRKIKVGIISSTSRQRLFFLNKKYDFFKEFHYRQFSYQTKVTKSDPKTYEIMASRLKLKPNEILYIDDEKEHLKAARKASVRTLLFKNNVKLEKDLMKLKLLG